MTDQRPSQPVCTHGKDCPATPDKPCFCGCHQGVEWAVLCPRDRHLRSHSDTYEDARKRAEWRDRDCGKCHPEDGKHVVVKRTVSAWKPVQHGDECPCEGCYDAKSEALWDASQP